MLLRFVFVLFLRTFSLYQSGSLPFVIILSELGFTQRSGYGGAVLSAGDTGILTTKARQAQRAVGPFPFALTEKCFFCLQI